MNETFESNRAMQVVESRKKALKRSEESEKEKRENEIAAAKNIVNLVCNVFEASDKSEQTKNVWHVSLYPYYNTKRKYMKIKCSVCFTEKLTDFNGASDKDSMLYSKQYKEVLGAIKVVNAIETTKGIFNKAIDYFEQMTHFKVSKHPLDSDMVTITLKSNNL